MKQVHVFTVIVMLCLGSSTVLAESDNPFGFETQTHPLQYEYCKKEEPHFAKGHAYRCRSAPRPHPDFQRYMVMFVEEVGLCSITAGTIPEYNSGLKMFKMFQTQIANKYGPPTSNDDEKMRKNRRAEMRWEPHAGFVGIGDIQSIRLNLHPRSIIASFWLVTFDECWKAIDQKRAEAF